MLWAAGCAETVPVTADSLTFQASVDWQCQMPEHESRRLQFRLPSHQEGVPDAKLVVWNFPGMRDAGDGRMIATHMDRWIDEFVQDDGASSRDAAVRREYRVNDLPVYCIAVSGRYVAESSPGSGVRVERPGHSMLGAYIVAPGGDYIVKLWGPESVVSHHAAAFDRFVKSVRAGDSHWPQEQPQGTSRTRTTLTATKQRP